MLVLHLPAVASYDSIVWLFIHLFEKVHFTFAIFNVIIGFICNARPHRRYEKIIPQKQHFQICKSKLYTTIS